MKEEIELTILMPCLNEAETLAICINKAQSFLAEHRISGEVLVADNGSTDGSQVIAIKCGARVAAVEERGYGAALNGGCKAALGTYIIMGDADDSYDFTALMPFMEKLRAGDELVMGNRFRGGIGKGAMPLLHKYLGNPILSFLGRLFYPSGIGDFHCGLRGYNSQAIRQLNLHATGMEYASEMVVKAALHGLKISEVPIILHPDGRSRPPHLRSWRDGWRHLKLLLMYAPNWLFFAPGLIFFLVGFGMMMMLSISPIWIAGIGFDVNTMLYMTALMIVGVHILSFWIIAKVYALQKRFIPTSRLVKYFNKLNINRGSVIGIVFISLGIFITICVFLFWRSKSYGDLNPQEIIRFTLPSIALIVTGVQIILTSFLLDILRIETS